MSLETARAALVEELDSLTARRDIIKQAIGTLDATLGASPPKPKARRTPPKAKTNGKAKVATKAKAKTNGKTGEAPAERKKPKWSPEARAAAKLRMKKYWAARKKAEGKTVTKSAAKGKRSRKTEARA